MNIDTLVSLQTQVENHERHLNNLQHYLAGFLKAGGEIDLGPSGTASAIKEALIYAQYLLRFNGRDLQRRVAADQSAGAQPEAEGP